MWQPVPGAVPWLRAELGELLLEVTTRAMTSGGGRWVWTVFAPGPNGSDRVRMCEGREKALGAATAAAVRSALEVTGGGLP